MVPLHARECKRLLLGIELPFYTQQHVWNLAFVIRKRTKNMASISVRVEICVALFSGAMNRLPYTPIGELAVLRAIHQYFICQKLHSVMSSLLQKHGLCTRPAAKCASLIISMEFTIDIASPKSFVHQRRRVGLSVNAKKAIQTTCTQSL